MHLLREFGCDRVQGYLYARAMPAEEFCDWVLRFNQGEAMEVMTRDGVATAVMGASRAVGSN